MHETIVMVTLKKRPLLQYCTYICHDFIPVFETCNYTCIMTCSITLAC